LVIHVAVLSSDSRLDEVLRAAGITATRLGRDGRGGVQGPPSAIIVDVRGQSQLPPALLTIRKDYPAASVILVASTLDPRVMLEAMRAGVSECVQEPLTPETLGQAIRRVVSGAQPVHAGQVFAFVGAKGGVGTTTLSVNTAAMLARAAKSDVLLIDLHVGLGDAALFLGVEPRFSVIDALENVHRVDESFFGQLHFSNDVYAQFDCGFRTLQRTHIELVGDKGNITIKTPFTPKLNEEIIVINGDEKQVITTPGEDLYLGEVENMADAILDDKATRISLADSRNNVATIKALLRSTQEGKPIKM